MRSADLFVSSSCAFWSHSLYSLPPQTRHRRLDSAKLCFPCSPRPGAPPILAPCNGSPPLRRTPSPRRSKRASGTPPTSSAPTPASRPRSTPRWGAAEYRTIPTRVGRTHETAGWPGGASDHPHAGGENLERIRTATASSGPSPRGWGEHRLRLGNLSDGRTIPTRVGRMSNVAHATTVTTDHPHAGGENSAGITSAPISYGPSPRGWGEHGRGKRLLLAPRTIPTRVGRTQD